jgi:DNA-binding NarL/FixJ family response regulator
MWSNGVEIMPGPYRILLADDHVLLRKLLRKLLSRTADLEVTAEVGDGVALLQSLEQAPPDLIILDIYMPYLRAMEATRLIKLRHPEVKVLIMVLDHEPEYVNQARRVGADGVLLKQDAAGEILTAIVTIMAGNFYLPPQFQGKKSCMAAFFKGRTDIQRCQDIAR